MKWMRHTAARTLRHAAAVAAVALTLGGAEARAAGLLVADGGFGGVLELKEHDVQVTVNNGVAVTTATQVFHNTENRQVEALYTFPVPRGASVSNFSMWINGKEMVGEVLEKKRAREIYQSYKPARKDPGLLEQVDYKTFEMRVFPINPNADQRVQITYYQELEFDGDWATYVYPLATSTRRGADARVTKRLGFTMNVKSQVPLAEVESPSHGQALAVARHSASYAQASLEKAGGSLDRDVVVAYRVARARTGLDLLASKEAGNDGTFRLTLTAGQDLAKADEGMDYLFLVDSSGSMDAEGKLLISKHSAGAFVRELGPGDRFEVLTFSVAPSLLFSRLEPATPEAAARAGAFLEALSARGGTVLSPALATAYKYLDASGGRVLNVVVLSDGLTDQAERPALVDALRSRPKGVRVFCVGVGNEVNRPLLEELADESGGLAAFVSSSDNFERQAKAFRRKLTQPVATDLGLAVDGVEVSDLEPRRLPSLYQGTPLTLYGRYRKGGTAQVTLTATVLGKEIRQAATLEFPEVDPANPEIERMWAGRKIDRLLREGDRSGSREAAIPEVVRLGEAYSIVTEYTSFLVLENDAEYQRWKIERRNALTNERDRRAQAVVRADLDGIAKKAVAGLGPEAVNAAPDDAVRTPARPSPAASPAPAPTRPSSAPSPSRRSADFSFGSGPVGPLFVGLAAWLARRKKKQG